MAALALLVPALLFLANFLAHHVGSLTPHRVGYYFLVILGSGTLLPLVTIRWLSARGLLEQPTGGARAEAVKIGGALAAGAALAAFPIGAHVWADPGRAVHLFVWLFMTSLAEVLVFLGVTYNAVYALLARTRSRWIALVLAAAVVSASFGLYHFTYYPPWNTLAVAVKLSGVWLEVTAVYLLTRSLWAAAVFNTVMAVIGFVLHGVSLFDEEPFAVGVLLDAISVVAITMAERALRKGWK